MEYKYKLSICMIVKDEEKNLGRCLESLAPLLEKPYVELVIVDTGSTDGTVGIAKRYTEKIYFHKWNNNFSEMRNISISYAAGEWIFIIDADEELENADEFIALFEGNLVERCNTIIVEVVNFIYEKRENDVNAINTSKRVFRNDGSFRYQGAVHNQPVCGGPFYTSRIRLLHYGYLVDDKELVEKKFKRTTSILKSELKKDPENIYYRYQLAVSYSNVDLKQALVEIRKAHELVKKLSPQDRIKYVYIYGVYARISNGNKKTAETIRICREGLGMVKDYVDLYYKLACCLLDVNEEKEAVRNFEEYLRLLERYNELPISKDPAFTMYHLDLYSRSKASHNIAVYYLKREEYGKALEYALKTTDTKEKLAIIIKSMLGMKDFRKIVEYYNSLEENKEIRNIFLEYLEIEKSHANEKERRSIEEAFLDVNDEYATLNRIRISSEEEATRLAKEFLQAADFDKLPVFYTDAIIPVIDDRRLVFSLFYNVNNSKLKSIILYLAKRHQNVRHALVCHVLDKSLRPGDLNGARVRKIIAAVLLLNEAEEAKKECREPEVVYTDIFKAYLEVGIEYITGLYRMERMRLAYRMLDNQEDRFLALMHFVQEAASRGNEKAAVKYFREALEVYPYMAVYMKSYRNELFKHDVQIYEKEEALSR